MGHTKKKRPRHGSRQVWPRKRANRIYTGIKNWSAGSKDLKLLGFAGYKAGMTHIIAVDGTAKSSTKGEEISLPVTIVECPDLKVAAIRLYSIGSGSLGNVCENVLLDVWSQALDAELARKINLPKKQKNTIQSAEAKLDKVSNIAVVVYTQPKETTIGRKMPEVFEIMVGGTDTKAKFDFAKDLLGKAVGIEQVFKPGQYLDLHVVTKGKGFQGVIKRFGVKLRQHKSEKGQRRTGTMGSHKGSNWWIPMCGQMGFHTRVEYNKKILKMADSKTEPITPNGGIVHYGEVRGKYVLIAGSVGGPRKRLVRMTFAIRKHRTEDAPTIIEISKRSQQ